jgi:DNA polymerase III subunit alpha
VSLSLENEDSEPTQPVDFVHLHIHSEYSLLDGSIKIKNLVKELKNRGVTAAALTDHDAMHGVLEYWLACKEAKINGIVGYEVNVPYRFPANAAQEKSSSHLVLLAENDLGFKNLVKLSTYANTSGKNLLGNDSFAIPWEVLGKHSAGIICLTACLKGELAVHLSKQETSEAQQFVRELVRVFGNNSVFVEMMDNGIPEQRTLIPLLADFAKNENLPLVATADVHYIGPKDKPTHLALLAIKHKLQKTEIKSFPTEVHFHLSSPEEMAHKFAQYPEALSNTRLIADRCQLDIKTGASYMPDYRQHPDEPADACIVRLSREGLLARRPAIEKARGADFNDEMWLDYEKRLEYELEVINKMQFAGYFLIVQDFINWAKLQSIPVGPGRGSAAGSLVTYALRITNIDPLRFNLLFERFLNPERISMPDIDTDFCQDRRQEVLEYVYTRYGRRNVSQIVTFGRLMAKNAIKSLARISGWSFFDSNEFVKLIPEKPGTTLEQAYLEEPALKLRLEKDERASELWAGALEIEGVLNSLGVHAAGVIISDRPLDEHCPLLESDGQVVTQFENKYAEKIGLIKFDFLGLKTLTVIDNAVRLVNKQRQSGESMLDIEEIELEDPAVYQCISTAHVTGIFQLESAGMRKLIYQLKPTCFNDIVAVLALFRPGPLGSGMVEDFVLRKHGINPVEYLIAELEPILADTYGVIVYQEQVQKIAAVLAGYSLGEADLLRRAMGKKDKNEMERQKARFVTGATTNQYDPQLAGDLFDLMAKFAEYGFNKSHTAAYGWVTYQTAYLKTYHPTEFMAAILSCDVDNSDKVLTYLDDCKRMGILVLPPCVNDSDYGFKMLNQQKIRFGLGAIKGVGQGAAELIAAERNKGGAYESVPEFIARVETRNLNKKIMESLIKAGAFDALASNRAELLGNCDAWLKSIGRSAEQKNQTGGGLFSFEEETINTQSLAPGPVKTRLDGNPVTIATFAPNSVVTTLGSSRSELQDILIGVQLKKCGPWSYLEMAQFEWSVFGFHVFAHPALLYVQDFQAFSACSLKELHLKVEAPSPKGFRKRSKPVRIAGMLTHFFEKRKKDDDSKFGVYVLSDGHQSLEITLFSDQYAALSRPFLPGELIWADCDLKPGVGDHTVRSSAQAMGLLADLRKGAATSCLLRAQSSKVLSSQNLQNLLEKCAKFKGKSNLVVELELPAEKALCRMEMNDIGLDLTDDLFKEMASFVPGLVSFTWCQNARSHQDTPLLKSNSVSLPA